MVEKHQLCPLSLKCLDIPQREGTLTDLQIKWIFYDNLEISFIISEQKHTLWPAVKPSSQDTSDEGLQHMFLLRNKKNHL